MCCHGNHLKRTDNNYFGSNTHCKIQLYKLMLWLWLAFLVRTTLSEKTSNIKTTVLQFMLEAPWRCTILCFPCRQYKLRRDKFYWSVWVSKIKMMGMLLNVVHRQVHKNISQRSLLGFITIPISWLWLWIFFTTSRDKDNSIHQTL